MAAGRAGQAVEQVEEADIAHRNPYLEGDFEIGDDEEWEEVPLHRVKIADSAAGRTFEVDVPEVRGPTASAHERQKRWGKGERRATCDVPFHGELASGVSCREFKLPGACC